MEILPLGDYYVVYCAWCDSCNKVFWARMETGEASCGACHRSLVPARRTRPPESRHLSVPDRLPR